ncbi:MAG: restriction endonuclease subunit S [Acetobacter sp.]|nr:restriction endonuclease subunit S [Acetobacter sp.]
MSPLPDYSDTQKKDWVKVKLGDCLIAHKSGKKHKKGKKPEHLSQKYSEGALPYATTEYFRTCKAVDFVPVYCLDSCVHIKKDELIIIWDGSNAGEVFIGREDSVLASTMALLEVNKTLLDTKFCYFFLKAAFKTLNGYATGATTPHVSSNILTNLEIPLPPLPEQRRIVAFLDEAFHNTTHLTEKITRSLRETQKLKNVFLHQAFTSANTAGWEYYPLEEVFTTRQGYDPSKNVSAYWENGTIPFIKMEDIRNYGQRLNKSHNYVTEQAVKTSGVFPSGSFIISTSATIGEHALVTVPFLTNRRFTCLFLKPAFEKRFERDFIFYYLYVLGQWCRRHVNSGTHAQVKMPLFRKFSFPIPPLPEQQRIVAFLDEAFTTIATLTTNAHNRLAEAQKLKNAYLQKAFESPEQILNTLTIRDPRP